MARNIEMNYKNGSDSYEILYPNNQVSSIIDLQSYLDDNYYNKTEIDSNTWSIGDIRPTTLELDDKWLLCDGSFLSQTQYESLYQIRSNNFNPYLSFQNSDIYYGNNGPFVSSYYVDLDNNREYAFLSNQGTYGAIAYRDISSSQWNMRYLNTSISSVYSIASNGNEVVFIGYYNSRYYVYYTTDITTNDFTMSNIQLTSSRVIEYYKGNWYMVFNSLQLWKSNTSSASSFSNISNFSLVVQNPGYQIQIFRDKDHLYLVLTGSTQTSNLFRTSISPVSLDSFQAFYNQQLYIKDSTGLIKVKYATYNNYILIVTGNNAFSGSLTTVYLNIFDSTTGSLIKTITTSNTDNPQNIVFNDKRVILSTGQEIQSYDFETGNLLYRVSNLYFPIYNVKGWFAFNSSNSYQCVQSLPSVPNIPVDGDDYYYYIKAKN